jgi:cytidine deaminase
MGIMRHSTTPLSQAVIVETLRDLRKHCLIDSSHFAVSALLEVTLSEHSYYYIGGVNVENAEHNRLSMHAEQNAIASACTLLGADIEFTAIWVMGAADTVQSETATLAGDTHVKVCGHCRQILLSFAARNAQVYTVSVNGEIGEPDPLDDLLIKGFKEHHLNPVMVDSLGSHKSQLASPAFPLMPLLEQTQELSSATIFQYLQLASPHILSADYQTSAITACLLQLKHHRYLPGVLVQDVAFLSTDALFAAVGLAVSHLGFQEICLDAVHCYSASPGLKQFSGSEIDLLARCIKKDLPLYVYQHDGSCTVSLFSDVIKTYCQRTVLGICE